ncbi:MAG: hypothetical protein K0R46_3368, partial [Herbinix sp.]|nr:hypothetical protein [Herbinix sp.]
KRNIIKCPICGRYYELYPDDSDPGCPYCAARIPVFTGNIMKYYAMTYSDEILNAIYGSGAYYFKTGDYFSLTVSNRTKTLGTRLLAPFIHGAPDINIHVECGGTIRDEVNR